MRALVSLIEDDLGGYRLTAELPARIPGSARAHNQRVMDAPHGTCPYSKALPGDTTV